MNAFALDQYLNNSCMYGDPNMESPSSNIEAENDVINRIKAAGSIDEIVDIISDELSSKIIEQLKD